MDDCRITKVQAERQDELTVQALERSEQSGINKMLARLTKQAHRSIQGVERRKRPRRRKR